MIGKTLSHYEISAKLGEGGMGEVYLAEDSRLGRQVALKVLPSDLAGSPSRLERFQREARTLATLDHPNIVHIYSVEEADGVHFLTMQLVRGQQLSEKIPPRGMPLREFFAVAAPLADALAAAHDKGITHRDLKPANVMLDDDGRVKVLDFGLAKLRAAEPGVDQSQLPTEAITQEGLVVGTVPYMSPEQAEGREIDHRSDIFSLGIVLYQMATGRAPFRGDTPLSVLSAIVKDNPPPVEQLNSGLPRHLGRIVRKCLEKDPDRRYQSTRDLHNDLVDLERETESGVVQPIGAESAAAAPRPRWLGGLLAVAGVALIALLVWQFVPERQSGGTDRLEWRTRRLTNLPGFQTEPTLSPEGRDFAFVEYTTGIRALSSRDSHIYTQRVGGARPINLTADQGGQNFHPAYSPDGQSIVFRSDRDGGGLFIMGATGENPRKVVDEGFNPDWSPDGGSIAYATTPSFDPRAIRLAARHDLRVRDLSTGTVRTVGQGFTPAWSPSGERIAFFHARKGGQRDIATLAADGGDEEQPVWITDDAYLDWSPEWSPDGRFLYFASNRGGAHNVWKVAIDQRTGEAKGEPSSVTRGGSETQGFLSIAADGRSIAYAALQETFNIQRVGFDPERLEIDGSVLPITSGPRSLGLFDLSADGKTIVASLRSPWEDVVLMNADGSGERKLTNDPENDRRPRFAPDGERIYFYSSRGGHSQIWAIRPDGTGLTRITDGDKGFAFSDPSPDGTRMSTNFGGGSEIFRLDEPYSGQVPQAFPVDAMGRRFAPREWMRDGSRILGGLRGSTLEGSSWAIYHLDSQQYELLDEANSLDGLTSLGIKGLFLGSLPSSLALYDHRTGQIRELLSVAPDALTGIRVAPDSRTIYFLRESMTSDIHLLEVSD